MIYPAGNTKIQDGSSTTGVENYKEFWYSLVGLDSIGQGFDGNGPVVRFLVGNSGQTLQVVAGLDRWHRRQRRTAARALAAAAARHAAGVSRPKSRRMSRSYRAPSRRCRTSTGRSRRALPTGADGMNPTDGHEGGLSVRDQIERYRTAFIAVRDDGR